MSTNDFDSVRLISEGGVRHKVVNGLTFSGDDEKVTAELGVVIRSVDFADFLDEMFPQPTIVGDQLINIGTRMYLKNAPWLVAKSFKAGPAKPGLPCDPFGADDTATEGTYSSLMHVDITFETMLEDSTNEPPDENNPETFLDHSLSAGAEFLQLPPSHVTTSQSDSMCPQCADPANEPEPPVFEANTDPQLGLYKIIPTIDHNLRWKFALRPDWTTIYRTLGHVNSNRIQLFNMAARETVLFSGISGQRSFRYFRRRIDQTPWSLDFKFSQRCIFEGNATKGWNHVYSPKKGWVKVKREDGTLLYPESDFRNLFKAGPP